MTSMKFQPGDKVKVVSRPVTAEDRKANRYFEHMAGLVGEVQSVYSEDEVSVKIDLTLLPDPAKSVRNEANRRMKEKFLAQASEEARSQLTPEETNFVTNYVLLCRSTDLEKN